MSADVMASDEEYEAFYESLGRHYPESQIVYQEALGRTRRIVVRSYLRRFAAHGLTLFDVGCNAGDYSLFYASLGQPAHGIDISASLIEEAKAKAERSGLSKATFEVANAETYMGAPRDAVLFSEVLEHVRRPQAALKSILRSLRLGGYLLLTTPAPTRDGRPFASFLRDRLFGKALVQTKIHESERTTIQTYVPGAYHYRHDEYYPIPLVRWVETFGFRCIRRGTFFTTERILCRLNGLPRAQVRIPILNLLSLNNVCLFKRESPARHPDSPGN